MKNIKIYTLAYLQNEELTEEDLHYLMDTQSLSYSIIMGLFKFMNIDISLREMRKLIKNTNWYDKYSWTVVERDNFQEMLQNIYCNLYTYGPQRALALAQMWVDNYGFKIK